MAGAKNAYWDDFLETAAIKYDLGQGQFCYILKPYERLEGKTINNGLDTELEMRLGVAKGSELYTYVSALGDYLNVVSELKYEIVKKQLLTVTGMGRVFYVRGDFVTPSAKLMLDVSPLKNLTLSTIAQLYIYENGNIAKGLDSGLNFDITPRDSFRTKFKLFFIELDQLMFDFRMAYRHQINDQTAYIAYTYFDANNVHLENILEYSPIPQLKISGNLIINTGEFQNDYDQNKIVNTLRNRINLKVDGQISEGLSATIEYSKEADDNGYSYLKTSLNFKL